MNQPHNSRRNFLKASGAATSALVLGAAQRTVSANDKLNVAFIGLGGRGRTLLKNVIRNPNYNIVALCDLRQDQIDRAQVICDEEDLSPKQYIDFETMIEYENLDAVIVATEVGNHAKVVVPVLEAGLHCFSEKPMDANVANVDAITKAARKAKGIYQVGFQRRYNPTFLAMIPEAQNSQYGMLRGLQGQWFFSGGMWDGGWVRDVAMSGGKLVEQACHHMDVFTWVTENHPVACQAVGRITYDHQRNVPEHLSEDLSGLNFIFPDGAFLTYMHYPLLPPQFNNEKLWVVREKALIDLPEGIVYHRHSHNEGEPEQKAEKTDYYEGTYHQFDGFAKHVRDGETPLSNVETARISTLTALLGHQAMYNWAQQTYEPSMIEWKDLGTSTDSA